MLWRVAHACWRSLRDRDRLRIGLFVPVEAAKCELTSFSFCNPAYARLVGNSGREELTTVKRRDSKIASITYK